MRKLKIPTTILLCISIVCLLCVVISSNSNILSESQICSVKIDSDTIHNSNSVDLTDVVELENFLDDLIIPEIEKSHTVGCAISVVSNGTILLSKGYGYADLENNKPVNANTTLFRIASVSKPITATAVMQLVEQGKLDLNEDVNTYLKDFQLPQIYPQPVTLHHLLTHTAGFEEGFLCYLYNRETSDITLGEVLAGGIPRQPWAPGTIASYSNYGLALAGYIVEVVSGDLYEEYVEENILKPLGMEHTTAWQPVPLDIVSDLSNGYDYYGDEYVELPFEYISTPPAGGISASATDMAKFMMAHLGRGQYNGIRILSEEMIDEMHSNHFSPHSGLNSICYGLFESNVNGMRLLLHGGDIYGFHTTLFLFPEKGVGFFMSVNTNTGVNVGNLILDEWFKRYLLSYESDPSAVTPLSGFQNRVGRVTGEFISTRRNHQNVAKIAIISPASSANLFNTIQVSANPDGTIQVLGLTLVETEPLLFEEVNGLNFKVAFIEGADGQIAFMYINGGVASYNKMQWYDTAAFQFTFLILLLGIYASAIFVWIIKLILNYKRKEKKETANGWRAGWVVFGNGLSLFALTFLIYFGLQYIIQLGMPNVLYFLGFTMIIPIVSVVLTCFTIYYCYLMWFGKGAPEKKIQWGIKSRIYYSIIMVMGLYSVWFYLYWNLLGFNF